MEDDPVLAEIQREIKSYGENVTALKDSMLKDLKVVRDLAQEAKSAAERPEIKAQIDALTTSVTEKQAAFEGLTRSLDDRLKDTEKKLNRPGGRGTETDDETKSVRAFMWAAGIARGEIKANASAEDWEPDLDGFKSYRGQYPRYLRRGDQAMRGDEVKAMSIGSDPDGGYFVLPTIGDRITGVIFETSPMRQISNVETISTDAIEYPRDDDEASTGWIGETEARTETNTPTAGMQRIPVHEQYAAPKITQKLLEDVAWDVEAWLAGKLSDKFSRTEAAAFVTGNGVKRPRGFTTYASGTFAAGGTGKIEQVAAGTGGLVAMDDLINTLTTLKEFYLGGANWLMQRATVGKVMLLKDGDGQYLWQPNNQAGKPSLLWGYEVRQAADMDAVAAGKLPIAFGNFRMGYTIVDRLGISTLRDPFTAKPFVVFYTRKRVGGDVTNFEAIKLLAT